jgi:hypothetical protein
MDGPGTSGCFTASLAFHPAASTAPASGNRRLYRRRSRGSAVERRSADLRDGRHRTGDGIEMELSSGIGEPATIEQWPISRMYPDCPTHTDWHATWSPFELATRLRGNARL